MAAASAAKNRTDLTQGPIWKKLIFFALPLLGSSLVQQLYNTVDIFFVGNFVPDQNAMSAVGASGMIVTLLVGFFTGMSVGSGVVASHFYGARNYRKLRQSVHTSIAVGLVGGAGLSVLGFFVSPLVLTWMHTPAEIMDMAVSYIQIYFLSVLPLVLYNLGTGILRAAGDSKRPMLFQLAGGILNILLDLLFVVVFQWGVVGVAVATLFSQTLPAVLVLVHMVRTKKPYRLILSRIRIHREMVAKIFRIGLPAGVQAIVITLSNVVVQSYINGFGPDPIAAFTAYFKVELIIYLPIVAVGQAITTFVGQNVGAGHWRRARKGLFAGTLLGLGCTAVTTAGTLLFARQAFAFLNPNPAVVELGVQIILITGPLYFLYVFLEGFSGAIRGSGSSAAPMAIVVANMCGLRLLLLAVLVPMWQSVKAVAVCYPVTWGSTALCLAGYYAFRELRRLRQNRRREGTALVGAAVRLKV